MKELFSRKQGRQQLKAQSMRGLTATASKGEMVSILSPKRGMNIGIFLKQFKRPVRDMIEAIKSGNGLSFGSGKLRELCKLLPDEHEMKDIIGFKGDPSALPEADLFMLMLIKIPSYEERLNGLVLKEEFFPFMDEMKTSIGTLTTAGKELLESDHLHSVIRLVLKTGNYMNAGGYAGSAVGFRMASLLKLVDTKANKPGMNLMHYVVMQAQKADVAWLKFPEQLRHIETAARINKCDIESEFERQIKKIQDAKDDSAKHEDLKAQMKDFLKEAEVCLAEIETDLQELQSVSDSVAEYFCEDPSNFKLEECCSIFNSFCEKFMRAMQDNKVREVAEVKRRHRERLQNAAKRRSTATCSSRDKEMEGVALESILQRFLTSRVSRRRPGQTSSTHGSPTSGSLKEITSQANLPAGIQNQEASLKAMGLCRKEWNSAVELTSLREEIQSNSEDNKATDRTLHGEDVKKEDSGEGVPQPGLRTASTSSSGRPFSVTVGDGLDELKDNSEEEAQRLREASKKVLRFQNSRSSVSSVDSCGENQNSAPSRTLSRQHTFNDDIETNPRDPTDEEVANFFNMPEISTKQILSRRHTLNFPNKAPASEEDEDNVWALASQRTPKHTASEASETAGLHSPKQQVFDCAEWSDNKNSDSPSAEKKSKPNVSLTNVPGEQDGEQNQDGAQKEIKPNDLRRSSQTIPPKSPWDQTESHGFFGFLKRLGEKSKLPNS